MSGGLIVISKSILEDVQNGLIAAFDKVAESRDSRKGNEMAELAERILTYEEEISRKKGGIVNQSALGNVQSKLLEEFNRISKSGENFALTDLSDQILKYEQKLDKANSLPGQSSQLNKLSNF